MFSLNKRKYIAIGEGNGNPLLYPCLGNPMDRGAWSAAVHGVAKSRIRLRDFTFNFHALEKEMATHSSVLAWRIPGTVEPGGLPSKGSHRVGHDWSDLAAEHVAVSRVRILAPREKNIEVKQGLDVLWWSYQNHWRKNYEIIFIIKILIKRKEQDYSSLILMFKK